MPPIAPEFTVVTPSDNMLPYLQRCRRSVADQDCAVEHIIVDALSTDGTAEWLAAETAITAIVEADQGMYDALNKGLRRAQGRFVSYLNCDEQYLPGTLATVRSFFDRHPDIDLLFGDTLLINPDGTLLSFRKGFVPRWPYILSSHLYVLSCTMFMRERVVREGCYFSTEYRDVGDAEFVVRLLRRGYRAAHLPRYLSAFTVTGTNMSAGANARREEVLLARQAPPWVRVLRKPLNVARLAEKFVRGNYHERFPLEYSVHVPSTSGSRRCFMVSEATYRWPRRSA